jgi:hypothetical protein
MYSYHYDDYIYMVGKYMYSDLKIVLVCGVGRLQLRQRGASVAGHTPFEPMEGLTYLPMASVQLRGSAWL